MTIAAYCRVSTVRQKADSQIAEIGKWLNANGYDEDQIQWFIDKETGKTLHRTQFNKLQKAIFAGESERWWSGNWIASAAAFETASTYWPIGATEAFASSASRRPST